MDYFNKSVCICCSLALKEFVLVNIKCLFTLKKYTEQKRKRCNACCFFVVFFVNQNQVLQFGL